MNAIHLDGHEQPTPREGQGLDGARFGDRKVSSSAGVKRIIGLHVLGRRGPTQALEAMQRGRVIRDLGGFRRLYIGGGFSGMGCWLCLWLFGQQIAGHNVEEAPAIAPAALQT